MFPKNPRAKYEAGATCNVQSESVVGEVAPNLSTTFTLTKTGILVECIFTYRIVNLTSHVFHVFFLRSVAGSEMVKNDSS